MKMHDGELDIEGELVRRLLDAQFPEMAEPPITAVESTGTVNAIYRLGDRLCVRLPRVEAWAQDLMKEWEWLPKLARCLSLLVPEPVAKGEPAGSYAFPWAIYGWIDGQPYSDELVADELEAAADLARFVTELREVDVPLEAPPGGRKPLRELDAVTRAALASARGVIDGDAALTAWDRALQAPACDDAPVWIHTDLLRPNVLVRDGRLCAVIDFGGLESVIAPPT
jgi:aminoglycoside phosphotransferase (APT) family kinase protein